MFRHFASILSRSLIRWVKKICITEELLFACTKLRYNSPFVSSPQIMEIRGIICSWATELMCRWRHHLRRRKSLIPIQVSSTFKITFLSKSMPKKARANCYRRIRFLCELAVHAMGTIFLYRMPKSVRSTLLMRWARGGPSLPSFSSFCM